VGFFEELLMVIVFGLADSSVEKLKGKHPERMASACIRGGILGTWIGLTAGSIKAFEAWYAAAGAIVFCYPVIAIVVGSIIAGLGIRVRTSTDRIRAKLFILTFIIGGAMGYLIAWMIIYIATSE
jgi:hypothetical protein